MPKNVRRVNCNGSPISALVLIAAACFVLRPTVEAQWLPTVYFTTFAPANDVAFTISTDRTSYRADDRIPLNYEIVNVGAKPLYVPQTTEKLMCPPRRHVEAWLESADGRYGGGLSSGGSCGQQGWTVTQRMNSGAVLLKPGDHTEGTLSVGTGGLPAGVYRLEAILSGWKVEEFSPDERTELARMGAPFLRGEVPASVKVTLTARMPLAPR